MNGRNREDTNQFVHQAESKEQMYRRYRKGLLKPVFRERAAAVALDVFGKKSPIVDIIREKENCTKKICEAVVKLTRDKPAEFNDAVEIFFNIIEVEGGPLENHCVATYYDCSRILIYKYDMTGLGANGFGDCGEARYLHTAVLYPGERIDKIKFKAAIPYGTPSGDANQTTVTVFSSISAP